MTRTALVLLATGAVAAVTGTALGIAAADTAPSPTDRPATVASGDDRTGRPDDNPTRGDETPGRPDDRRTSDDDAGRPDDDPTRRDRTATRTARPAGDVPAGASAQRDRAVRVALARTGGGRVVTVEAETEHGRAVWSVRIVRDDARLRVDVDAATGRVVRAPAGTATVRDDDATGRDDHAGRADDDRRGDDRRRGADDAGRVAAGAAPLTARAVACRW
ncbi:PepSY domain-containing protein, partial [Micromonospora sp. PLK6-60]|uniref:PepSY domain-containing protein n=1 Tax=Micromonospora sp. PLK6-60 TaxID=2873383 RepID=UPI001CA69076